MAAPTGLVRSSLANEAARAGRWLDQVLDATKDDAQKEMLTKDLLQRLADAEAQASLFEPCAEELENVGIRLNRKPPDVTVRPTKGGGITCGCSTPVDFVDILGSDAGLKFQATVPLTHFDEEVCATILRQNFGGSVVKEQTWLIVFKN